jgi:hypothetical protein
MFANLLWPLFSLLQDENDNAPIFTEEIYVITISENLPVGTVIGNVLAPDADSGTNGEVFYTSSPQELVTVDNVTGDVILLIIPDFETLSMQSIEVIMRVCIVANCSDLGGTLRGLSRVLGLSIDLSRLQPLRAL